MRINREDCVGLIIDVQERIFPAMSEQDDLLATLVNLVEGLKVLGVPMLSTVQYTKGLGPTVLAMKEIFPHGVAEIEKMCFSCCGSEEFNLALKSLNKTYVIVAGIESHVCVQQTVIELVDLGYVPVVVADCVSSRKMSDKEIALQRMVAEGAILTTLEAILFELMKVSGTDEFKKISKLIK